jgi:hypothetical protein
MSQKSDSRFFSQPSNNTFYFLDYRFKKGHGIRRDFCDHHPFRLTVIYQRLVHQDLFRLQTGLRGNQYLHVFIDLCLAGQDIAFLYFLPGKKADGVFVCPHLTVGNLNTTLTAYPFSPAKTVDISTRFFSRFHNGGPMLYLGNLTIRQKVTL